MLKKNDLVKQFELVVKQEIINHNEAVLNSNQSINKMKQELESFKTKLNKYEYIQTENKSKTSQTINDECALADRICRERYHILDDRINKLSNSISNIEAEVLKISKSYINESEFNCALDIYERGIERITTAFHATQKNCDFKLQQLEKSYKDQFEKYKKEIEATPTVMEVFKKEISKKLEDQKNDNEGILKEVRLYKKQIFIQEKEIEHLLTRCNRRGV